MRQFLALATAAVLAVSSVAAPALAEPPSWAPAHGWRAKHGDHHRHGHGHERHHQHHRTATRSYGAAPAGDLLSCRSELVGQVAGGAVGALAGSNIGDGSGQLVAIGAGALVGVLLGGEIGAQIDRADRNCLRGTLEHVPAGRTVAWQNPDSGVRYRATPVRTYQTERGRYCREYTTTAVVGGREQQVYGTACRQPDGAWELQS